MRIANLLTEDMIISELKGKDRDEVLREMVDFLKNKKKINNASELLERLIQRENLGSTAVGDGIAIPHCKIAELRSPILLLAISKKGVAFGSANGKLTSIFFMLVSPQENPSLNLQILAAIAQLIRQAPSLPKKIMAAKSARRILEIIREEEEKIYE
ncbi:MAG: PTS sugar transporter subunit IIA [Candidatus Aminicenantes bacterium]|nr:PTS sugar transporter subunit IIA [Candidatus Aminicenantes bacterium]